MISKLSAEKKPTPIVCFHCDEVMENPDLFCKQLCADEAIFVQSMRRWISQGRDKDPDEGRRFKRVAQNIPTRRRVFYVA